MNSVIVSWLCLGLGVVAYGLGGAGLAAGSTGGIRGALRSRDWWVGTGGQAVGFLLTLVARRDLPLLLVQAAVVAALAITALVQHATGRRRLEARDSLAICAVVVGIASIGFASVPGSAPSPSWQHASILGVTIVAVALVGLPKVAGSAASLLYGSASGVGFGVMAVAARLLIADDAHPLWRLWELPAASWSTGILGVAGLGLAQIHLTRGLARGYSVGVLSCMYGLATIYGASLGWWLLSEAPRAGTAPLLILALILGVLGSRQLLRHVEQVDV